jgi:hypothetical protein
LHVFGFGVATGATEEEVDVVHSGPAATNAARASTKKAFIMRVIVVVGTVRWVDSYETVAHSAKDYIPSQVEGR